MTNDLTTSAASFPRQKYFAVPLKCVNCLPNTTYDIYLDGTPWNSYTKPFGGVLGSPLTSRSDGKLFLQVHMRTKYIQNYLVAPTLANTNIMQKTHTITLVDPFNNSSTITIPVTLKAGANGFST